jgi:hypothetical protein
MLNYYAVSSPEQARKQKDEKNAQIYGIIWPHSIAAGDPGQTVQQLGPIYSRHASFAGIEAFLCLALPAVLEIAIVSVIEPLQVPEVLHQSQIYCAIVDQPILDRIPAHLQPDEVGALK